MSLRYRVARIVRSDCACSGSEIGQSASNCRKWPVLVTIVGSWPTNSVDEFPFTPTTLNFERRIFVMLLSLGASIMFAPESTRTFLVELLVPFVIEIELGWAGGLIDSVRTVVAVSVISSEPISEIISIRIDIVNRILQTPLRFFPRVRP